MLTMHIRHMCGMTFGRFLRGLGDHLLFLGGCQWDQIFRDFKTWILKVFNPELTVRSEVLPRKSYEGITHTKCFD